MKFSAILLCAFVANQSIGSILSFSSPPRAWGLSRTHLSAVKEITTTIDPVQLVNHYTQIAIEEAGTEAGLQALAELGQQCSQRRPYDFDSSPKSSLHGSILSPQRQILSPATTTAFLDQVAFMEENGWLSTNPDSVDGLPSLHLNLISGGEPLFSQKDEGKLDDFQGGIQKLLSIVEPQIYGQLLPTVRRLMDSDDVVVSDVFLRRYGQDIAGGETRQGISAHYDVFSTVTAVIAMDDVAAAGDNGLYTTARTNDGSQTSNHASLRRFFPLNSGDGVLHTWDVLHGVDVEPGLDRTSLIVWFSTKEAMSNSASEVTGPAEPAPVSPWLSKHQSRESNDVVQFVLGSALESSSGPVDGVESGASPSMHHEENTVALQGKNVEHNPHELYLQSAAQENPFALSRLGSLCEGGALLPELVKQAVDMLSNLDAPPDSMTSLLNDDDQNQSLARRFWLEGSLRGNSNAQTALGDEAMEKGVIQNREDLRLMAATLFGLAAQQGLEQAIDSLSRVVEYEASICESKEDFLVSPILKVAQAASMYT